MSLTRIAAPAVILATALALTACSLPAPKPSSAPATTTTPAAETTTPTGPEGCVDIPASTVEQIASGANDTPITITNAAGVPHPTEPDYYFVAANFTTPGIDKPETGVWMVKGLEGSGITLAADGMAQQFTDWPGQMNGHTFNVTEPGVKEAKACLKG